MHWVTLLQIVNVHVRQYIALLFCIIIWSEQKCVTGNIMKNSKVYCLISVYSCFVIILKTCIFSATLRRGRGCYGMVGGCFTNVLHNSENYHQEHATEPSRLPKDVVAAWGAVILRFHGVANLRCYNLWCSMLGLFESGAVSVVSR